MGRPPRLNAAGTLYHLTCRGNRKQEIYTDAHDRRRFLALVAREVDELGWRCHSYCLMTNHYHLLVETPHANVSEGMHHLNGVYAKWFNWRHGYEGHLFERRFRDVVVEGQAQLLELTRYIVLNPVRANLVRHPREWQWSSYGELAGERPAAACASVWVLSLFAADAARARELYCDFVLSGIRNGDLGRVLMPGTRTRPELPSRSRRRRRSVAPAGSRAARPAGRRH